MKGCSENIFWMASRALAGYEIITNFLEFVALREDFICVKQCRMTNNPAV